MKFITVSLGMKSLLFSRRKRRFTCTLLQLLNFVQGTRQEVVWTWLLEEDSCCCSVTSWGKWEVSGWSAIFKLVFRCTDCTEFKIIMTIMELFIKLVVPADIILLPES